MHSCCGNSGDGPWNQLTECRSLQWVAIIYPDIPGYTTSSVSAEVVVLATPKAEAEASISRTNLYGIWCFPVFSCFLFSTGTLPLHDLLVPTPDIPVTVGTSVIELMERNRSSAPLQLERSDPGNQ